MNRFSEDHLKMSKGRKAPRKEKHLRRNILNELQVAQDENKALEKFLDEQALLDQEAMELANEREHDAETERLYREEMNNYDPFFYDGFNMMCNDHYDYHDDDRAF